MDEKEQKKIDEKEKCFVMMPISDQGDYPEGHFQKVYEQIFQPAIEQAGYQPYRVDENAISDRIIDKIFNAIQECPMALCDLSNRNPNVLYELGLRQAYDKPVVLVQDEKTDKIFDVSGISTVFYKSDRLFENVIDARERISRAISDTRDGKKNSIVKVVRAQTAKISTEDMTKEDKIEIMLSGIIDDLKQIKNNKNYENNGSNTFRTELANSQKHPDHTSDIVGFWLNNGITDSQIKNRIKSMEEKCDVKIPYKKDKNRLLVDLSDVPPFMEDEIMWELINFFGNSFFKP